MTFATRFSRDAARWASLASVLTLVAAIALWWAFQGANTNRVTAYFDQTIGLYPGSTVRVLGVPIGTIDDVRPIGTAVRVDMSVDRGVQIPADADAVVITPSVVSDRYVQLAPVYNGGPVLADNATIPRSRTATPVELDQLYHSLDKLAASLGPNGANKNGDLSDLLNTLAANLDGNGKNLHDTITRLAALSTTLDGNKNNLFGTVDNLATLTTTLADSDATIRQFTQQLSDVSGFLSSERGNLGDAVRQLGTSLAQVQAFINDNRSALKSNVDNLAAVTRVLVDERSSLAEVLDVAPLGLTNGIDTYNGSSGTIDGRININELSDPPIVEVCKLMRQLSPNNMPPVLANACDRIAPIVQGLVPLPSPAQVLAAMQRGTLPPLPLPLAGIVYGTPGATGTGGH